MVDTGHVIPWYHKIGTWLSYQYWVAKLQKLAARAVRLALTADAE